MVSPVAVSVSEFIDYALSLVTLMIIYYSIKLLFFLPELTADEKKKVEQEGEEKAQQQYATFKRSMQVSPTLAVMKQAMESAEEALGSQNYDQRFKAYDAINTLINQLHKATINLRKLRRDFPEREFPEAFQTLNTIIAGITLMGPMLTKDIKDKFPDLKKAKAPHWDTFLADVSFESELEKCRDALGNVWKELVTLKEVKQQNQGPSPTPP